MKINRQHDTGYPFYMDFIYGRIYGDVKTCNKNDVLWRCNLRMLWHYKRMVDEIIQELNQEDSVCQFGIVFGNLIDEVALAVGKKGKYNIIDVNKAEIKRVSDKYGDLYKHVTLIHDNVALLEPKPLYDAVICFMLLSMVPDSQKSKIIDNALLMLKPGGKAIFVDWNRPKKYSILGKIVTSYQKLYNPFAEELQEKSIKKISSSGDNNEFIWRQTTYCGGLIQKVVVTRHKGK